MKALTTAIGLAAALALALPAAAPGAETESVVPPENSAATQYTEAIPTAGGDREARGGDGRKRSPAKVLGAANAKELESKGQAGREVARVTAETAPPTSAPAEQAPAEAPSDDTDGQSGGGGPAKPGGGDSGGPAQPSRPEAAGNRPQASTELPSGSSGLGEVLAEATGSSSSGDLGPLLPLAILAAIAWALAYFWRQRRPAE